MTDEIQRDGVPHSGVPGADSTAGAAGEVPAASWQQAPAEPEVAQAESAQPAFASPVVGQPEVTQPESADSVPANPGYLQSGASQAYPGYGQRDRMDDSYSAYPSASGASSHGPSGRFPLNEPLIGVSDSATSAPCMPMPQAAPNRSMPVQGLPAPGVPMIEVNPGALFDSVLSPDDLPPSLRPLSALDYVGYSILYAIPVIGLIAMISFSVSSSNKNLKNFSRAALIFRVLLIILFVLLIILSLASGDDLSTNSATTAV